MKRIFFIFIPLFIISSCAKHFVPAQYQFEEKKITASDTRDEKMWSEILPYKDALDKEMNTVIAVSDTVLTKSQPESDLGYLMCDLMLKKSRDYYGKPVDFTFVNYGGIRLPNLPKGDITLGNIVELMPFENRIVIMTLNGRTVDSLFNHFAAKGGWQVSGASYTINKFPGVNTTWSAVGIYIQNDPLDVYKNYTVAVSDYLAQGGDNCDMLKGKPYIDTKKTIREALIEGLKEMNARGEHIKSVIDGRIQVVY